MVKRSRALPLVLLAIFGLGLLGIYLSNIERRPDLESVEFHNLGTDRPVTLDKLIGKKDVTIVIFFKAGETSLENISKTFLKLRDAKLNYTFNVIFIGIDGDYKAYKDFLFNNPKIFIPFVWLHTNNTNLFKYMEKPGSPNIYLAKKMGSLKFSYISTEMSLTNLIKEMDKFVSKA